MNEITFTLRLPENADAVRDLVARRDHLAIMPETPNVLGRDGGDHVRAAIEELDAEISRVIHVDLTTGRIA